VDGEVGLPRRSLERAFAREIQKIEAAGHAHATVVVVEARNDALDQITYAVVVLYEPLPFDRASLAESRAREPRHYARLAQKIRRRWLKRSARRVNHAHRVLDADESVSARRLEVELARERVQENFRRSLPDAHRSVALHVRVAAHGARARAGAAQLPAKQKQIDYLLNVRDRVLVLRQPHRPA